MLFPSSLLAAFVAGLLTVGAADNATTPYKEIVENTNQSLLWGPYRPNLYFGVRPRIPKSLMSGLMWANVDSFETVQNSKQFAALSTGI